MFLMIEFSTAAYRVPWCFCKTTQELLTALPLSVCTRSLALAGVWGEHCPGRCGHLCAHEIPQVSYSETLCCHFSGLWPWVMAMVNPVFSGNRIYWWHTCGPSKAGKMDLNSDRAVKTSYVKSLDRQDVTLHTEPGKMIRRASNLMEEAASGLLIVKAWLENRFFRACLCGGEYEIT